MAVASLATLIDLQGNSFTMAVASFTTFDRIASQGYADS